MHEMHDRFRLLRSQYLITIVSFCDRYGMLKVMLTTFKHNPQAQSFFKDKLK